MRTVKKRKNPINKDLMEKMIGIIVHGYGPRKFSEMLAYKAADNYLWCKDCDKEYSDCTCEGDSIHINDPENYVGGPCRDCFQNYCVCNYNLQTKDNIIKEIANLAKNWFDHNQLKYFIKEITDVYPLWDDYPHAQQRLQKLLNFLQQKKNPKYTKKVKKESKKR